MKTASGQTSRHFSWPCVTTSPSASRSLNFAGRKSRPLSSSFGVYVPMKNIGHLHSSPFLHYAPLYATFPHRQPRRACRGVFLGVFLGVWCRAGARSARGQREAGVLPAGDVPGRVRAGQRAAPPPVAQAAPRASSRGGARGWGTVGRDVGRDAGREAGRGMEAGRGTETIS